MTLAASRVGVGANSKLPPTVQAQEPCALTPARVAVISAVPRPTAEITPVSLTLATSLSDEVKVK